MVECSLLVQIPLGLTCVSCQSHPRHQMDVLLVQNYPNGVGELLL